MKFKKGSICLDDLFAASKAGHPAITTAKNGKKYANFVMFENETPDEYGNIGSIQLNKKEKEEKAVYIGNLRGEKKQESQASNDESPF